MNTMNTNENPKFATPHIATNNTTYSEPDRRPPRPPNNSYPHDEGILLADTTHQTLSRSFQPAQHQLVTHHPTHLSPTNLTSSLHHVPSPYMPIHHLRTPPTLAVDQHILRGVRKEIPELQPPPRFHSKSPSIYPTKLSAPAKSVPLMQTPAYLFPHEHDRRMYGHHFDPHPLANCPPHFSIPYEYDYYRLAYARTPPPRPYVIRPPLLYDHGMRDGVYGLRREDYGFYGGEAYGRMADSLFDFESSPFRCNLCNIKAGTEDQLVAHFNGKKHQARLASAGPKKAPKSACEVVADVCPPLESAQTVFEPQEALQAEQPPPTAEKAQEVDEKIEAKLCTATTASTPTIPIPSPCVIYSTTGSDAATTVHAPTPASPVVAPTPATTTTLATTATPDAAKSTKPPKQQRKPTATVLTRPLAYQQPPYYAPPMAYYYRQPSMYGANWGAFYPPPREPYPAFYAPLPDPRHYRNAPLLPVPLKRAPLKGCEICGIPNFTSLQQLTAHTSGKKHLAKINPSAISTATPSVPPKILARGSSLSSPSSPSTSPNRETLPEGDHPSEPPSGSAPQSVNENHNENTFMLDLKMRDASCATST